jgi:hypothetical protein
MLFFILRVDQNVINEDHDKLVQLGHEHRIHQVHEVSRSIGKPEGPEKATRGGGGVNERQLKFHE